MPKPLQFTRPATTIGLASNQALARDLKRAYERFRRDFVPESVYRLASATLADKALDLKFTAKCSYAEAQAEVLRKEPYLQLAFKGIKPDSAFADVEIRDEEVRNGD